MNRILLTLLGAFLIIIGIDGLLTGESTGIAAGYTSPRDITLKNDPLEYWFSLSFQFSVGIILIKRNLFLDKKK